MTPFSRPPATSAHRSLHFGWVSCATLVNFNNYIALIPRFSDNAKLRFSLGSIAAAVSLAVAVTGKTGDPVYAGVVAWALSAVASEKGWAAMKVRAFLQRELVDDAGKAVVVVGVGAVVLVVVAVVVFVL